MPAARSPEAAIAARERRWIVSSRRSARAARNRAIRIAPRTALSGWPARIQQTRTSARRSRARPEDGSRDRRSIAKRAHGQRQKTADRENRSQGVIVRENAKAVAPKNAAGRVISISRSQRRTPRSATNNLAATDSVKASGRGIGNMRNVNGENAADWPLAASAMPQPFQRLRHGSEPSFQAIRTALA